VQRCNNDIDQLDSDKWNDETAEPVDEQVLSQQRGRRHGFVTDASQREGMRPTMMSALKITAERTADSALCRCMM